jgi:hypothetical protein
MSELLAELREHWDDGYWWADRQLLLAALCALAAGIIGLAMKILEAYALRAINGVPDAG